MLECVVKTSSEVQRLNIKSVLWTRYPHEHGEPEEILLSDNQRSTEDGNYSFAAPHWDNTNKNVSLLISKAAAKNEGNYQCEVKTNAGDALYHNFISFNVKGKL